MMMMMNTMLHYYYYYYCKKPNNDDDDLVGYEAPTFVLNRHEKIHNVKHVIICYRYKQMASHLVERENPCVVSHVLCW
jgi:hypothetical protein